MFFIKAFEGKNEWWRYLLGFLGIFLILAIVVQVSMFILLSMYPSLDDLDPDSWQNVNMNLNVKLLFDLSSFVLGFFLFFVLFQGLHHRSYQSLIDPFPPLKIKPFYMMLGLLLGALLLLEGAVAYIDPSNYHFNYQGVDFWFLLMISLLLIPLQAGLEELIFRSYLFQALVMRMGNLWLPMIITSIIFALMHGFNPEIAQYGYLNPLVYYFLTGIFLSIIVVMEDNLYLAWAFHSANNILAACFFGYEGSALETYSLYKMIELDMQYLVLQALVQFTILLFLFKWIRKWGSFSILWKPIVRPEIT